MTLDALAGLIDIRHVPFTAPEGRLLLVLDRDATSLALRTAAYEVPMESTGPIRSLSFLGPDGRALPISAVASPHRVDLMVGDRSAVIAVADPSTLVVGLPVGSCVIRMETTAPEGRLVLGPHGGRSTDPLTPFGYRCVAASWQTTLDEVVDGRQVVRLELEAAAGDRLLLSLDPAILGRPAAPVDEAVAVSARDWEAWFARVSAGAAGRGDTAMRAAMRAAWVLRANTIRLALEPSLTAVVPSKVGYVAVWQWDAYFHALGLRHLQPTLAREQLRLALRWQLPEGMLPDVAHDAGILATATDMVPADQERSLLHVGRKLTDRPRRLLVAPITKPPLTAMAAWKVHQADPDRAFLEEVYPAIVRSHAWWWTHSMPAGRTLPIYLHPYSSGIDDSPLWDLGMPTATPDLPAYLALQADYLAQIAGELGREADAERWRAEAATTTSRLVRRHWRASRGTFAAIHGGRVVPADTALGLMPIVTGRLPPRIAASLVASMTDPGRFWPRFPVPSVALDDPEFSRTTMWRGPTWLFLDSLFVDGLRRSGFPDVASRLRERALDMVERNPDIAEYHDPLDGSRPPRATTMFSGTAALYLDLLLSGSS